MMSVMLARGAAVPLLFASLLASAAPAGALVLVSSATIAGGSSGTGLAIDSSGVLYYCGGGSATGAPIARLTTDLTLLSSVTVPAPTTNGLTLNDMKLGPDGLLYAVGSSSAGASSDDVFVAKYDTALTLVSSTVFNGSGNSDDWSNGLAFDQAGRVLVAGSVCDAGGSVCRPWLGAFSSSLVLLSSAVYPGAVNDEFKAAAVDAAGNVYAAGYIGSSMLVAKYGSDLGLLTARTVAPAAVSNRMYGVAAAPDGTVYACGMAQAGGGNRWAYAERLDSSLALVSSATFVSGTDSRCQNILFDGAGDLYTGGSRGADPWAHKLTSGLVLVSSVTTTGGGSSSGKRIVLDKVGNLYITGSGVTGYVVKYAQTDSAALVSGGASYAMPGGALTVSAPPGAFSGAVAMTFTDPSPFPADGAGLVGTGVGAAIALNPATQPVQPVALSMPYRDADVAGFDESKLVLARYDDAARVWVPLPSTLDRAGNRVTGRTDHFSTFQVMAVASNELSLVRVFPNPLRPSQGHLQMTVINAPAEARVRIFTILGEKVADLTATSAGQAVWDGRNGAGQKVASGVYLALVTSGGASRTLKLAVER